MTKCVLVLLAVASCRPHGGTAPDGAPAATASSTPSSAPSARDAMRAWENAESARDGAALAKTYADRVKYYGADLARDECVKRANAFFAKSPVQTFAKLEIATHRDHAEATVEKTVTLVGIATRYVQHLTLALDHGAWLVTEETDETTEKNLAAIPRRACEHAVRALTDAEMSGEAYDDVSVSVNRDSADVVYWGKVDTGTGGTTPHASSFHVNLAAGTATRERMNRAGDPVGSDPLTIDAAKLSAARTACKP